jgi:putative ABC transport system permease protein
MNVGEAFQTALQDLAAHKLRTALTMLGMIFGVGAVVAMLSIGAGAERQALDQIERMGLHNVLLRARQMKPEELTKIRKDSPGVSWRDAEAIQEGVPGVELVMARVEIQTPKILAAHAKTDAKVYGVSHRLADIGHMATEEGRFLDAFDEKEHAQVCVIGPNVSRDLFGFGSAVGQDVKIDDVWFEVVGVLARAAAAPASGKNIQSSAKEIYVPVTTATRKFDRDLLESPLDELTVQLDGKTSPIESAPMIRNLIDRIHGGANDFEVVVPEELLEQKRRTQRLFSIVMGAIAGISLLVGGIGIMNIMLATVFERTREIGVRRAVGARRREIRDQFLIEAFAISTIGGLTGVVMGIGLAKVVAAYASWPTIVTLSSVLLSTGVSVAVGLISGVYPAYRAATMDPIEALRHE